MANKGLRVSTYALQNVNNHSTTFKQKAGRAALLSYLTSPPTYKSISEEHAMGAYVYKLTYKIDKLNRLSFAG